MVNDADRSNLIADVLSRDPRLITPSRRTPEQDTVYINALSNEYAGNDFLLHSLSWAKQAQDHQISSCFPCSAIPKIGVFGVDRVALMCAMVTLETLVEKRLSSH
jgi:hypothetical protein